MEPDVVESELGQAGHVTTRGGRAENRSAPRATGRQRRRWPRSSRGSSATACRSDSSSGTGAGSDRPTGRERSPSDRRTPSAGCSGLPASSA